MSVSSINFIVQKSQISKIETVDWDNLPFGKVFSDHMFLMEYSNGKCQQGKIIPFQHISMHPAMSAIHYGQSIFEGLKAYRTVGNEVNIFRPDMNAKRFADSAKRMCMPQVEEEVFVEAVRKLVEIDSNWVTNRSGYSLYIRPFLFDL